MNALHWFRHDLRLEDNEALIKACMGSPTSETISSENGSDTSNNVACVFVIEPKWFETNQFGLTHMGEHRYQFLLHCLRDLEARLSAKGLTLHVYKGDAVFVISRLLQQNSINAISVEQHHGVNERIALEKIKSAHPHLQYLEGNSGYLYEEHQFPFSLENMPDTFSPFRKKVEKYASTRPIIAFDMNANSFALKDEGLVRFDGDGDSGSEVEGGEYLAGETGALKRMQTYIFDTDGIATYKQTRNGLDGWEFSSRLSSYLALGCVSPAKVLSSIKEYETQRGANESTYWLFFELLWREFFHWSHKKHGNAYFVKNGIQNKDPATAMDSKAFERWCNGNTGYSIVDACMKQLNDTGFMSNRGRQLVASCFVHELALDWRYGAAYFEQQLIDFDVASNWGNWQYLAGVGSDPRGHRQFNLEKQTQHYDPQGKFISKWLQT